MKHKNTKKPIIRWESAEIPHPKRSLLWKFVAFTSLSLAIVLGIYLEAKTFSLAIATFAVTYYLVSRKPITKITITISELGIQIAEKFYPYNKIKKFWIIFEPPYVNTLHLHIRGQIFTEIKLQLHNQNPEPIRQILATKITELKDQHQKFSEILLRILKI